MTIDNVLELTDDRIHELEADVGHRERELQNVGYKLRNVLIKLNDIDDPADMQLEPLKKDLQDVYHTIRPVDLPT